jgi:hypothetical protein
MNNKHKKFQNQHYVSEVLTKRFTNSEKRLHRYYVEHRKWRTTGPGKIFSHPGYTQMLADGEIDNSLERTFNIVETHLPDTLLALDDAATRAVTKFSDKNYSNMAWYCGFLYTLSPFFKALATVDFLEELNLQVSIGSGDYWIPI